MKKGGLENLLKQSIKLFVENDAHLFAVGINERSMTHKFAEYLQLQLGNEWDVDCEYNRNLGDIKIIGTIKQYVGKTTLTNDTEATSIYPDIIIHKRNSTTNLLVIEAKKSPLTKKSRDKDINKLVVIKKQLQYSYAMFLVFNLRQKSIKYEFVD